VSALCRRFGISHKTGYKWLKRYAEGAVTGAVEGAVKAWQDRPRRPGSSPRRSSGTREEAGEAATPWKRFEHRDQAQDEFDRGRLIHNRERPHEALSMQPRAIPPARAACLACCRPSNTASTTACARSHTAAGSASGDGTSTSPKPWPDKPSPCTLASMQRTRSKSISAIHFSFPSI
jgi:hypothetical protein